MADIKLKNAEQDVILDIVLNSTHQFYFTVEVLDDQLMQHFHDSGSWNSKTSFQLGKAANLIGLYLTIYWTIIEPQGDAKPYDGDGIVKQNGQPLKNVQQCNGTSGKTDSSVTTIGKFII